MKCHYCGQEMDAHQQYCLWCGTKQSCEDAGTEVSAPPAQALPAIPEPAPEVPVPEKKASEASSAAAVVSNDAALAEFPVFTSVRHPAGSMPPALELPAKRRLWKMLLFGFLTLGIYPVVIWSRMVTELNLAASRYDGKRTMPYFAMTLLAPVTLGIYPLVWMHRFCRRIADELQRRQLGGGFGPSTFWLWNVLGSLILVGPFVFTHKLLRSMNRINADYNING